MTAIKQGPEAVCAAIVATLQTHLNAAIDEVWSAWANADPAGEKAPPKVYPQRIYKFRRALVDLGNYAVVMVTPAPGQQIANHMSTLAGSADAYDVWRHRVHVIVGCVSDDYYALEAMSTRTLWAVRTTLLTYPLLDGSLGGYGGSLDLGSMSNDQPMEFGNNLMQKWGGVEVVVTVEEAIQ